MAALELTAAALAGWDNPRRECPFIPTSPNADAWHVGQHLRREGSPCPRMVRASRGNSVRVNGKHVYRLEYARDGSTTVIDPTS